MDRVDRKHAPLTQAGEGRQNYIAARRECDRAIQLDRRFISFISHPLGPERLGQLAMSFTARGNIYLAIPGMEYMNDEVGRSPETEQSDAFAFFNFGHLESPKPDNSSAQ